MGYSIALAAAGCEVLEYEHTGSYQGDWYALVKYQDEVGVVTGNYGSCSVCDSFEAEFNYNDDEKPDYQERLAAFGETYLPLLPIDLQIKNLTASIADYDWGDEKEVLKLLISWKEKYAI